MLAKINEAGNVYFTLMKTRIVVGVVVIGAGLIAWLGWPAKAPADSAPKPAEAKAAAAIVQLAPAVAVPAMAPAKPQVEKPAVAAAPAGTAPASAAAINNDPQPQADLNACIQQSINLLQAHDIVGLIKTLMPPDALKREMDQGHATSAEDYAAQMLAKQPNVEQRISEMVQAMQSVQGQMPEMSEDGNKATYPTTTPNAKGSRDLVFVKQNGFWYLQ